ncbi:pyruvate carboxylase [Desulfobotulus alkaliphilus]|uniref:pyruvate carboxylase n=1 Tax=Desulfobotulus alkaliphilus TaxID=622671 RepID=A0A562RPJ3_9BACT|nr:pyruvate carboxylase [Desulfobotulus alkaliphilus]TWI70290.1 pyruvate carboxylase [Desulfobotulus alkaliphilus]
MGAQTFEEFRSEIRRRRESGNDVRILIANRGIPARRIARAVTELGATACITATDIDKTSPAAIGARKLMLLGENPTAYLDLDRIVKKAKEEGIEAIHPGWGFGAEDDSFPAKCEEAGIIFIGPPQKAMHELGNKVAVRALAQKVGVPVVPGSEGAVGIPEARKIAHELGFPIMLKAEGGGGGRGIYEVYSDADLESSFVKASALAEASFGNPRLFVERLLPEVRHIEIQVIADKYGNVFAFDERDCTVQRNHQKLIEISPSPWPKMTEELRARLKEYAIRLVKSVDYYSLATVEFLVDMEGNPYLIEANTRLQVEHGITECRYGVDLVEEQIAIAYGCALRFNEERTKPHQHAMQVRINCEDPKKGFSPNAGRITRYTSPGGQGIRIDSCITAGYEFPSQYDSAASLLIAYADSWSKNVEQMRRALKECMISGVKTTIPFYKVVLEREEFISGNYDTKFVQKNPDLFDYVDQQPEALRLSRLIAEISAKGYNEYLSLDKYRGLHDKRLGPCTPVIPFTPERDVVAHVPLRRGQSRESILDYVRTAGKVFFTDTTCRDQTQSNSGNRFRLAEDRLIGPILDKCGFFSLENGGGAHFHVAMLGNMTYPFKEADEWNDFAPDTLKQILIRSTNVLGYKPQPKNLMQTTGEMICENYDVIRCFDFLNHIENMRPFAEVVLPKKYKIFQPAISMSHARGFDADHYLGVTEEILAMVADVAGVSLEEASRIIILGLKDMAGVCPPAMIRDLVKRLRVKYPDLVLHYHRHCTDGLFSPALSAAAAAGCHILDVAIGASVRWYGQGDALATAALIEEEHGLEICLDKERVRDAGFVLKQIMPYYDRYTAPYFQGVDYEVVQHGMPGGATSSSQEGAMKQGYIHLLPYMLKYLAGIRQIVRYHDVTPGSQITWNTAFLSVTGAYKRGGEKNVRKLLDVLETVVNTPEEALSDEMKKARLEIYQEANDAFRDLILGKFGKLPLGFPPEWVYESAFGPDYKKSMEKRTEDSPLKHLEPMDMDLEKEALAKALNREPTKEELVLYLNHPGDALKTIRFQEKYGDPNHLPLDVWFEGIEKGSSCSFKDGRGMPHEMTILDLSLPDEDGNVVVRYHLDSEIMTHVVKVAEPLRGGTAGMEMADSDNPYHIASPSNGDLWVTHVNVGDMVKAGEEVFNISIMKQEKAVLSAVDGRVKRVLKSARYQVDRKMVPVKDGELLVELEPVSANRCKDCGAPVQEDFVFCPSCGKKQG